MDAQQLVSEMAERGITRVKIGGFDIDGVPRGKYMSLEKFCSAVEGGFGFCDVIFGWDIADQLYDRASVTGWHSGFPDALGVPDVDTLRDSPWEPGTAIVIADFRQADGTPHAACPRSLLKKLRDRAREQGYEAKFAAEFEFFMFRESPDSLHQKQFHNLDSLTPGMFGYSWLRTGQNRELMADILDKMTAFDVEIEGLHTETGPGVYEVAIRYDDMLRAADKAALFKVGLKQIAHEHGLSVTFMAKWNAALPGSSGHIHQSLFKGGKNVFASTPGSGAERADAERADAMSAPLRHYVGGLCSLMGELTAMMSPTINAYKRYVPGVWAPLTVSWGVENRTSAVRLIALESEKAARVEHRQGAADINPYLAFAACFGAGMYGIEHGIEPPDETRGDASDEGEPLPATLEAATERLASSERARAIFGSEFVDHYVHTRRWEVREYNKAVTDWELKRYFEAT
jgi:glutamine synthetase